MNEGLILFYAAGKSLTPCKRIGMISLADVGKRYGSHVKVEPRKRKRFGVNRWASPEHETGRRFELFTVTAHGALPDRLAEW